MQMKPENLIYLLYYWYHFEEILKFPNKKAIRILLKFSWPLQATDVICNFFPSGWICVKEEAGWKDDISPTAPL